MDDQIKQITEKKVTPEEATIILAFAVLEMSRRMKEQEALSAQRNDSLLTRLNDLQEAINDLPLIKKLVFGAVGVILLSVMGALVTVVVIRQ